MKEDKGKKEIKPKGKWLYWLSMGIILIIIYKLLDNFTAIGNWIGNLLKILAPFLSAVLIAYILYVPCEKLEKILLKHKWKHARKWSIGIVYTIVIILIVLILKFVIPAVISSVLDLVNNIQSYYNSVNNSEIDLSWAPVFQNVGPYVQDNILKPIVEYIQKIDLQNLLSLDMIKNYIDSAIGVVKFLANAFIAIICSIYILSERTSIIKFITKYAKSKMRLEGYLKFKRYFTEGSQIFFGFLSSQIIDGCVVAVITSIAMSIIGVKYSVLLGVMIGLFNLIPFFGAIVAVIFAVLITILTSGWQKALIMAIVVTVLQQIDANIINPKITGSRLEISPLLVVFSVSVIGAYFGIIGMFLAVPIVTLIKLIIDDGIADRLRKNRNKKKIIEGNNIEDNDEK